MAREDRPGSRQLVAYVTPAEVDIAALRQKATGALAEYMVPAAFVALPELPTTPNGKLDRRALPAPDFGAQTTAGLPATAEEEVLCRLFAEVLGLPAVGVEDDFFDLGGDSIVSIQLVGRARGSGLVLTPREVFTHRTPAALAAIVARVDEELAAEDPEEAVGTAPLTPIMEWVKGRGGPITHFHQSMCLRVPAACDEGTLAATLQAVLDHHDVLRLRLTDAGIVVSDRGSVRAGALLHRVDAAGLDPAARRALIAEHGEAAQARLDPERGVVLQAVWFDSGRAQPGRLLVLLHHLAVDGISWRILLPDLAAAWEAVAAGLPARLQPVRTSFRRWAQRLAEASLTRIGELPLWRETLATPDPLLGAGPLDPTRDVAHTARALTVSLPPEQTEALLTTVPAAFHAEVNDVLLTAFAVAVSNWRRQQGRGDGTAVLVDLEGHGREEIIDGIDLSRTVGWFTSLYPVRLDGGAPEEFLTGGAATGQALKAVKEQLRRVPDKGIGYGMLRYLNPDTRPELAAYATPQLGFNYLGRFTTGAATAQTDDGADWTVAADAGDLLGGGSDAGLAQAHVLEVNAITEDRPDGPRLSATWAWAAALLAERDVRELADMWFAALTALVTHVRLGGAGGVTPSDIALVTLSQDELDEFDDDEL